MHVHAAVFSLWVLVLSRRPPSSSRGTCRLHRQLGNAGMIYGALVFAVGLLVSVGAPALRVRAAFYPLEVGGVIALYNLTDMLLFGAFLALAFAYRNRPELHKRWIIAATAALCGAALGRVVPGNTPQYLAAVAVAAARDDRRRSRDAPPRALDPGRQRRSARRRLLQGAALFRADLARRRWSIAAAICLIRAACSMIPRASGPRGGRRRPERSTTKSINPLNLIRLVPAKGRDIPIFPAR